SLGARIWVECDEDGDLLERLAAASTAQHFRASQLGALGERDRWPAIGAAAELALQLGDACLQAHRLLRCRCCIVRSSAPSRWLKLSVSRSRRRCSSVLFAAPSRTRSSLARRRERSVATASEAHSASSPRAVLISSSRASASRRVKTGSASRR